MAVDKLVDSTQLDSDLTSVANAIRTKGGTSGQLAFPAGFVGAIEAIPSGGGGGFSLDIPKVDDGNAYIYIYLSYDQDKSVKIYIKSKNTRTFSADWGDNSTETFNDVTYIEHTYANIGFYKIKLKILDGVPELGGDGNVWLIGGGSYPERTNIYKLVGLETGNWGIASNEFIPYSNAVVVYAKRCTSLSYNAIYARESRLLRIIELPTISQDYNSYQLYGSFALNELTIPAGVTRIGGNALQNCGMIKLHMEASTPPTLGSSTAFNNNIITIYVPRGSLTAYQTANNWATYATYIQEEPE